MSAVLNALKFFGPWCEEPSTATAHGGGGCAVAANLCISLLVLHVVEPGTANREDVRYETTEPDGPTARGRNPPQERRRNPTGRCWNDRTIGVCNIGKTTLYTVWPTRRASAGLKSEVPLVGSRERSPRCGRR